MRDASQPLTIQLAFVDIDPHGTNAATVASIAREAVADLRAQGYTIQPIDTGARGAVPFDVIMEVAQRIYEQRELIKQLAELATPIITYLLATRPKKPASTPAAQSKIDVTVQLGQIRIVIPPDKANDDDWLLEQLLQSDPNLPATITPDTQLTVNVQITPPPPPDL
jgi:hypothetical protein